MKEPVAFRLAYGAVALALVVLVLAAREVYLLDLPAWVYQGAALAELAAGREAGAYALQSYPIPNALATVFFALTVPLLGPAGAGKAFVALYLAAAFAAAYVLARAADPTTAARRAAVLAATLFVSSSFWNGYLNINPGERVAACAALVLVAVVPLPRRLLTALAVVALGFLAYDAVFLVAHQEGLPAAERARHYAERVEAVRARRAAPEEGHVGAFRDPHAYASEALYPDARLKYLNHLLYFHAPLYEAAARGDFSLPSFDSGLLTERPAP